MAKPELDSPDACPSGSSDLGQNPLAPKEQDPKHSTPADNEDTKYQYPSGLSVTLILTSVTLAYFLFFLDLAVISTATPAITSEFDSLVDVGW